MTDYHRPVLLQESIDGLNIKPEGIYVDATFGGGGHSREILKHLNKKGKLIGFDQDKDVLANIPKDKRFLFVQHNFRFLRNFLKYHKIEKIDGLLADLGVSSHHFDTAERGFSFRFDSNIDMRMNQNAEFSAYDLLNTYSDEKLAKIFREYGEIKSAWRLAQAIVSYRQNKPIAETQDLTEAIKDIMPKHGENQFQAKLYQAVRIEVNHEVEYLKSLFEQSLEFLKPGSRMVVISYHSLEDRMTKNFFREGTFVKDTSIDLYGNKQKVFQLINKKLITPSDEELKINNRSRSAKLRIAEKT
jgi:16S rRNA (cytosine1402-N4)-methyltransferase